MTATLHLLCGKIASGKSTLAAKLAAAPNTVLISEDVWLNLLFGEQMATIPDYLACSAKLRAAMAPLVTDILTAGTSVVLDFPANTPDTRAWMRTVITDTKADHVLHLLDLPDAVCFDRLQTRNATGDNPFAVTKDQFDRITAAFQPPTPDEGFTILRHSA